jgi:acyl-CoA thioesterase
MDAYSELLGLEVIEAGDGAATVHATIKAEHLNLHGSAHGGFLYSLADAAFALASNSRGAVAVALTTHMDYFRPVREGTVLTAQAFEEQLGRKTATYRVEIRDGNRLVALFTGRVFREKTVLSNEQRVPRDE